MAAYTLVVQLTTISILNSGDTVQTRKGFAVKVKNLDAVNVVSFSEQASPAGPVTAGNQSSLLPAPANGRLDYAYLRPDTKYFFRSAVAPCLCCFEEIPIQG